MSTKKNIIPTPRSAAANLKVNRAVCSPAVIGTLIPATFVRAILTGACPLSDGAVGVDVLRVLAAADSSQLQASAEVSVRGGHPGS